MQDGVSGATAHKLIFSGAGLSAGGGVLAWLSENHTLLASLGVLVGMVIGFAGLIINHRANKRREAREIELHLARMAEFAAAKSNGHGRLTEDEH